MQHLRYLMQLLYNRLHGMSIGFCEKIPGMVKFVNLSQITRSEFVDIAQEFFRLILRRMWFAQLLCKFVQTH